MREPPSQGGKSPPKSSTRHVVVFILLLAAVIVLGLLLLRDTGRSARPPGKAVADVSRPAEPPIQYRPPTTLPASQPDDDQAQKDRWEAPPPPVLPPLPKAPGPHVLVDGKWVPYRGTGPRAYTEFRSTPPMHFVSDEEERQFREYWVKEASTRAQIYCDVTNVCPPTSDVQRMAESLFDDILPQRGDESMDQYWARVERWNRTRNEWWGAFRDTPQSVFTFAGLSQFRGAPPAPPLEPDPVYQESPATQPASGPAPAPASQGQGRP